MPDITCADQFATLAHHKGDTVAVRHNDTSLTYRALAGQAGFVARLLRDHGVGPGDVVASMLDRSPLGIATMLGAWAVGAAHAYLDPDEPASRLARTLPVLGARVVLADRANARRVPRSVMLDKVGVAAYEPVTGRSPDDVAYLVQTSGSTGEPAAVAVAHGGVLAYLTALSARIGPVPGTFATTTTFASDLGYTAVFGSLLTGGTLDIIDPTTVSNPKALAARLREHPVNAVKCTPSQLDTLMRHRDPASVLPKDVLVVGGEVFPARLARAVLAARPDLAVFNHYGPTETTIGALVHQVTRDDVDSGVIPIGRPLDGVEITVLTESGRAVADGQPGQLHISGPTLALGYVRDQDLTDERFVVRGGNRWYASGDLVRRNERGDVEFLGRVDRQLKVDGRRIEPVEIENVLLTQRGIQQAVVTVEPVTPNGPPELVAYLVGLAEPTSLMRRLRQALPPGHVPSRICHVVRIPTTRNGKTNLTALRKLAADAIKSAGAAAQRPQTATERLIADIWREVLRHVEVDVHTRFGDLGGDAAKSRAVLGKLRLHYPSLTAGQLTAQRTVAELAVALDAADAGSGPSSKIRL